MKKQFSRWLSSLLAVIMIIGMFPTAAFAVVANEDDDRPLDNGQTSITVNVRDAASPDKALSGAGIKLERITSGRYMDIGILYTDGAGSVTWNQLEAGWYRITQISVPNGYKVNDTPITRWFGSSEGNHIVTIQDTPQNTLTVTRLANGKPVEGASFEVRDTNNGLIASGTTDSTGTWFAGAIPPGDYTVREVYTPVGIDSVVTGMNPQSVHLAATQESNVSLLFSSSVQPTLIIHYMDRETGLPIAGARFTLTRVTAPSSVISTEIVTNENGIAVVPNLEPGDYMLTQTFMPDGYVSNLQSSSFTVVSASDGAIVRDFWADRYSTVSVVVADSQTGQPVPGATVVLYSQGNQIVGGPSLTDTSGRVTFTGLLPGNYTAVVTNVPDGYMVDSTAIPVFVSSNSDNEYVFTVTQKGSLTIYARSDDGSPLANCVFTVRRQGGEKIGTYTTNTSGYVMVPGLEDGYYVIEQESAPNGYVITSATQTVRVRSGAMAEVTFTDRAKPYTMNEGYVGTSALNTALADRFAPVILGDLTSITNVLSACVPDAKPEHIAICASLYDTVRKAVADGECTEESVTTRGYIAALKSVRLLPLRTALMDQVGDRPQDPENRNAIKTFIRSAVPA